METRSCHKSLEEVKGAALALIRVSLFLATLFGRTNAESGCGVKELFKDDGWEIPGLSGATVQDRALLAGQGVETTVETLAPLTPAASVMTALCAPEEPGRILIRNQTVNVQGLRRYSILGHTFAYRVIAEDVAVHGDERVALASVEILMYYDLDGSGIFKLREYASRVPYKFRIPEWVKAKSGDRQ
jgi:hypothetical protein